MSRRGQFHGYCSVRCRGLCGLLSAGWCRPPAALRCARGRRLPVAARALSRRSGMRGWRVRASRPSPDWCRASLALCIGIRPGGEGAVFWVALRSGDRAGALLALRPRKAAAVRCALGGGCAARRSCHACGQAWQMGILVAVYFGYLLLLSFYGPGGSKAMEDPSRVPRSGNLPYSPARHSGASPRVRRTGSLSPALPVSARRVTERPMGCDPDWVAGRCGGQLRRLRPVPFAPLRRREGRGIPGQAQTCAR